MTPQGPPPIPQPARPVAGEWLFKRGGQVFGPVPGHALVAMLYRGEATAETLVAQEGGAFRPLAEVPAFAVHLGKAEAQLRVEAEVSGARLLKRRRRLLAGAGIAGAAVLLLAGGGYGAWWLATVKPWQKRSALLEDFGGGVRLASVARVGASRHAEELEVEVPLAPAPGEPPRAPRRPAPAPAPAAPSGELVAAQYDVSHIQAVVAREQRTLAPCLRAETQRSPGFAGEIPLEFAIGNDGRVAQLWIDEPRFKRGDLHDCLLRTLRAWSFRPFPGQRPTVLLSFRIGSR